MAQFLKNEVKDQIKDSAINVFTEKGYQKASIKEIADDAGVSVGNVYRYYKNKEDLYSHVIENVVDGLNRVMIHEFDRKELGLSYGSDEEVKMLHSRLYKPMEEFIQLYRQERLVFNMLLKGERDLHYKMTIQHFINLLKENLFRLWNRNETISFDMVEVSAFTNAVVFGVIDLLEKVDEEELDYRLTNFVVAMVNGYFYVKKKMEATDEE